jgi:hypothetical protein
MAGTTSGFRYSTPLVIPDASSVEDHKTFEEINYIFNALRTLAARIDATTGALSPLQSQWPTISPLDSVLGTNTNKFYAITTENISYGAMVNFTNASATTVTARNAKASSASLAAVGYCVTEGGVLAGQWGEFVVGPGLNYGISGMVPGTWYYLSPTSSAGQVTNTKPTTAGQIVQLVGIAITNSKLLVGALNNWIQL